MLHHVAKFFQAISRLPIYCRRLRATWMQHGRRSGALEGRALNMKKRPPMPSRDSGGKFTLNNPDDGTPITEMFKLGDLLLGAG
jgi:hypothetical protein